MTDRQPFRMRDASEALIDGIDDRFAARFCCILPEPTMRSHNAPELMAAHVAREWQACVAWLESAQCQPPEDAMIRMLAAAGDHMQTLTSSDPVLPPITAADAASAVYGETDRVPIYGMLLHLATIETGSALLVPIRALAAQLLLAHAMLIYHDDGARIDMCREVMAARSSKPPVPSIVPACRLVRQMANGRYAEVVARLPTTRVVPTRSYEQLRAGLHDASAPCRDGLDQICITLRDARSGAKRRQRVTLVDGASPPPDTGSEGMAETPPDPTRLRDDDADAKPASSPGRSPYSRPGRHSDVPEELRVSALPASAEREYQRLGLSAAEVRPARTTLRSPDTKSERPGTSLSMRIRCQQGMLQDRARVNQRLPIHRGVIRQDELEHLITALRPWMDGANGCPTANTRAEAEAIAMLAMILATGAGPEELHGLHVSRQQEDTIPTAQTRVLLLDSTQSLNLWIRVPIPAMDPHLYADVSDLLHPISDGLWLPLPKPLVDLLIRVREAAGTKGSATIFASALADIDQAATAKLRKINARHRSQLKLNQLPAVLPQVIADRTGNWSYAWILTGDGDPHVHTPLVYQTTPASTLVTIYTRSVARIFGLPAPPAKGAPPADDHHSLRHYGSALHPLDGVWAGIASELRRLLPPPPAIHAPVPQHVQHHNAFALYTVMMALVGTGLRAIRDPIESSLDIDWDHGLLFVVDKESHAYAHERCIPLAPSVLGQLRAYRRHLHALANRLALRDLDVATMLRAADSGQNPDIPFLCFLNGDLQTQRVQPATLMPRLQSVFPAPLNLGRHHIRTHLTRSRCPGEWIEALMGHEPTGMEAFGRHSALSIADLRKLAEEWIEPMLRDHGWVVTEGVPA